MENRRAENEKKASFGEVLQRILLVAGLLLNAYLLFINYTGRRLPVGVDLVDGCSMMPTLSDGSKIIVSTLPWSIDAIRTGDIVIADREEYTVIKRVIAMPGEKVKIVNEGDHADIYVCSSDRDFMPSDRLKEDYILEPMKPVEGKEQEWVLSEDEYFICGDNRNDSLDSRSYGPIKKDKLIGRVIYCP